MQRATQELCPAFLILTEETYASTETRSQITAHKPLRGSGP